MALMPLMNEMNGSGAEILIDPTVKINMFNVGSRILRGLISIYVKVGSQCLYLLYATASFNLLGRIHCAVGTSDIMH
jgi:hypothetical protein